MGRGMMFNRMMVRENNNRCPYCGSSLSDAAGAWVIHRPYTCDRNPDVIRQKLEKEIEDLKLKNNQNNVVS